jgi:pimeloyl-ACP methyl ester carboxylesterase
LKRKPLLKATEHQKRIMKKTLIILFFRYYLNTLSLISPIKAGKAGFLMFCHPRRRAVKPHHLEFLNSSEKFTVEYTGKKVQGYKWGNGEKKLLLVHGWESHSYWWKSIVTTLPKEKFTLISIDAPGHGLSEGSFIHLPHYSGLIEKLIETHGGFYAILGHSFGAFSSMYTLFRAPQLPVSKLVLMASPGEMQEFVDYYQALIKFTPRTMKAILDYFVKMISHKPDYFSLKEFAKGIKIPGLFVHDTEDKEAPYRHALAAHKNWPNSEMITTTGLGHNLKSTDLIKEVEKFLG